MSTRSSCTKMLPDPGPDFKLPDVSEEEFFRTDGDFVEDEGLLSTGAWKNEPDEEPGEDEA